MMANYGWTTVACRPDVRELISGVARALSTSVSGLLEEIVVDAMTEAYKTDKMTPTAKAIVEKFLEGRAAKARVEASIKE